MSSVLGRCPSASWGVKPGGTLWRLTGPRGFRAQCSGCMQSDVQTHKPGSAHPVSHQSKPSGTVQLLRVLSKVVHWVSPGECTGRSHQPLPATLRVEKGDGLGENYSLCSSYLTTLPAKSHPTLSMPAASWGSSQPRARANSRHDLAPGLETRGPLPTLPPATLEGPESHSACTASVLLRC